MLDLGDGAFEQVYPLGEETALRLPYDLPDDAAELPSSLAEAAYRSLRPIVVSPDGVQTPADQGVDAESAVFALSERTTPVVLLRLGTTGRAPIEPDELRLIMTAARPLYSAYSLKKTTVFYREIIQPLSFDAEFDEFMSELGSLLLAASGMEFAALRQLRGDELELVDAWGFKRAIEQSRLSWPVDRFEPFRRAALGQIGSVIDTSVDGYEEFRSVPGLEDVRSFIAVPVSVGGETFGVLSCAARCPYDFTKVDELRMEALANSVGVAIANFRNINGNVLNFTDLTELSVTATTAEVAHAARHEVKALADTAHSLAHHVFSAKPGKRRDADFERLERLLLDISPAIDKIRIASRPIKYVKQRKSLVAEWEDVIDLLQGRLDQEKISYERSGPELAVPIIEDLFRHVFLHLILNSIDAFRGRGQGAHKPPHSGRLIRLDIDRENERTKQVTFRYTDNATGISPTAVRVRTSEDGEVELPRIVRDTRHESKAVIDELPISQRIFKPNVTSKGRAGSGWGLYLVRRILDEHGGTIDLTDYRKGVTFSISMPK